MKPEPFDPAKHLDNPEAIQAYVEEQQAYIAELEAEIEEEARLNGMGGEREVALRAEVNRLKALDREAAEYVESVLCMRTHFTGDTPYVGWKGLGLALNEALDERDRLQAALRALVERIDQVHQDPAYISLLTIHQIHCGDYRGPTYARELDAARSALVG